VIRRLVGLGLVGAVTAFAAERWLQTRKLADPASPIETLVVIDAPIERVWDEVVDVERQPRWMHDLRSVRVLTPGPLRVGSRAEGKVRAFGLTATDPIEVTALDPPHRYAIRHVGTFKGSGDVRLESGADGTTTIVRWTEILVPPALPRLGGLALRFAFGPIFQADLHRLRALVEAG
jgi:uncharacterized membrane protein